MERLKRRYKRLLAGYQSTASEIERHNLMRIYAYNKSYGTYTEILEHIYFSYFLIQKKLEKNENIILDVLLNNDPKCVEEITWEIGEQRNAVDVIMTNQTMYCA